MRLRRRRLLLGLAATFGAAAGAWGQGAAPLPRVGVIFNGARESQKLATESFLQGLREQGYVDGRNIDLDIRYAGARLEELPAIVGELLARRPRVLVVSGSQAIWAARNATSTVPIVMSSVGDPVGQGLIKSLGRPGGNVTGLALMTEVLAAKRLELLREVLPAAKRVGRLFNPSNPAAVLAGRQEQAAAARLGFELRPYGARDAVELDRALADIAARRPQAVTVSEDALFANYGDKLVARLARERIASVWGWPQLVIAGGLMSYAASAHDQFLRAAAYVRRILEGAAPAGLPVEQASRFELFVNLKTAKALGVVVPREVLLRAELVIE